MFLNRTTVIDDIPVTSSSPQNSSLNRKDFGSSGPMSFGVHDDTLFNTVFDAQLAKKISDSFALGVIGEYGTDQYRLNGTVGFQLSSEDVLKLSAEYFDQTLPLSFDSGDINQDVSQNAYGARFQHNLHQAVFQTINVGGYWAQAENVNLSTINYSANDGLEYSNQRNIAGATTQGYDLGGTLRLTQTTSLDAQC